MAEKQKVMVFFSHSVPLPLCSFSYVQPVPKPKVRELHVSRRLVPSQIHCEVL